MADNLDNLPEGQVVQEVLKEIKGFGDDIIGVKKQLDELNKEYKNLKSTLESDKVDLTKREKLADAIVTRQEELDKIVAKQTQVIGDIETAMKRPQSVSVEGSDKVLKEALDHYISCKATKGDGGVNWKMIKDYSANVEEYNTYKKAFDNFLRMDEKLVTPEEFKTLSVGVDPHGGYTVTPFMATQILTRLYESDPIRQLAQSMTISTDAVEWLVDRDQATVGWEGETQTTTETGTPDLGRKRIAVHQLYAKPTATQQLLEDSAINIESWLANKVAERMGRTEAAAFVTGDGVGKPRGFLTYANGTNWGQIEQINMGAAATLTADGFINIKYHMREEFLNTGTWLMNRLTVRDCMYLKNGVGDYIWKPSNITLDPSSSILGLPVRMSTTMPAVAAGALAVVLADFRETYMIVDRLGITIQRDPYTKKPFIEFYTRKRVGGDVINYDSIKIGAIAV
jgi:HK97 family phage major capsid protein